MDAQLKRGMLEACVLAVLLRGDSYGYQIVKELSAYIEISESTLYPILKKLEKSGYLTTYSQLHQGRKRKYYSITALGKQQIQQLHEEWVSYRDTIEGIIEGRLRK